MEWFAERNTRFYQALKRSLLMSRFQGYGMCYAHTHMCQGLPRPLHAPINTRRSGINTRRSGTGQAGRFRFRASTKPLAAQRHRLGLNPQGEVRMSIPRAASNRGNGIDPDAVAGTHFTPQVEKGTYRDTHGAPPQCRMQTGRPQTCFLAAVLGKGGG